MARPTTLAKPPAPAGAAQGRDCRTVRPVGPIKTHTLPSPTIPVLRRPALPGPVPHEPAPRGPARQPAQRPVRLLSIPEAADQLGISEKGVRRAIGRGDLVAHRIGRLLRIAEDDLAAFVALRRGWV